MSELDDSFDLEMAASSLRSDMSDVHIFLKVLAGNLAEALGDRISLQRVGGLFKKSDAIKSISIKMGNDQFDAVVAGTALNCTIGHTSGGIRIRSEQVGMDVWISKLLASLKAEASHSQLARQALENILVGGTS